MKAGFAPTLRCPRCHAPGALVLGRATIRGGEARHGRLACRACPYETEIQDGIVDVLHEPPDFVVKEAAGLGRFAEHMRNDGWTRERVLRLPEEHDGYWWTQAALMKQTLATVAPEPGAKLLDLGSNTCWASAEFARNGLDVTALDISLHEMQGLRTAQWQFEAKHVYFERVLGVMFDLPFVDGAYDYVWACEVLHHNHRSNLERTLRECFRVLRPGGTLIVANEPLRNVRTPKLNPGEEVAEFEGHEHAYMRFTYTSLAEKAGFDVEVRGPWFNDLHGPDNISISREMNDLHILKAAVGGMVRRRPRLMRAALAYRAYLKGGTSLHMVCTKPPVG